MKSPYAKPEVVELPKTTEEDFVRRFNEVKLLVEATRDQYCPGACELVFDRVVVEPGCRGVLVVFSFRVGEWSREYRESFVLADDRQCEHETARDWPETFSIFESVITVGFKEVARDLMLLLARGGRR